jgi:hypothetical protein
MTTEIMQHRAVMLPANYFEKYFWLDVQFITELAAYKG